MFQGKVDQDNLKQSSSVVNSQVADSLGQLLEDLNMENEYESVKEQTPNEETDDPTVLAEYEEMDSLGLPINFGSSQKKRRAQKRR